MVASSWPFVTGVLKSTSMLWIGPGDVGARPARSRPGFTVPVAVTVGGDRTAVDGRRRRTAGRRPRCRRANSHQPPAPTQEQRQGRAQPVASREASWRRNDRESTRGLTRSSADHQHGAAARLRARRVPTAERIAAPLGRPSVRARVSVEPTARGAGVASTCRACCCARRASPTQPRGDGRPRPGAAGVRRRRRDRHGRCGATCAGSGTTCADGAWGSTGGDVRPSCGVCSAIASPLARERAMPVALRRLEPGRRDRPRGDARASRARRRASSRSAPR